MSWITLTPNDLTERLTAPEYSAIKTAATGSFGNPVPDVLAGVVAEVRGRVAACARNRLGPEGTIPEELRATALAIARWRVLSRLPGVGSLQDDARRHEYQDALALLGDVAACRFAIVQPAETADGETGGAAAELAVSSRRRTSAASLEGL